MLKVQAKILSCLIRNQKRFVCSITNSSGPVQGKLHQMADQAFAQDSSVSRVPYVECVFVNIKMKYHKPIKAMYVVIYYICEIWQK